MALEGLTFCQRRSCDVLISVGILDDTGDIAFADMMTTDFQRRLCDDECQFKVPSLGRICASLAPGYSRQLKFMQRPLHMLLRLLLRHSD